MRLLIIICCASILASCSSSKKTQQTTTEFDLQKDWKESGYSEAIVRDFSSLDGCGFLITLQKSELILNPSSEIPQDFQNDSTLVWVKYSLLKDGFNTCMYGKPISITDIQPRSFK